MKLLRKAGVTSEIWQVFIQDTSKFDGSGVTGLTNATVTSAYYHRDTDTTATVIALVSMTVGTFTSKGFKEIDSVNMPGWYQFCPPDAALASGAKSCGFLLKGATNMAPLAIEAQLVAVDVDDAAAYGLSRIDAAITSRMATFSLPTNFASLAIDSSGRVNAFLIGILTTVFTEGATGRVAAAFKQFFNIATPTATMDHGVLVDTATTLTNAPPDSTGVGTLLTRIPSGIFTGMTSLAQWLGAMAGKQTANSTARTEIRATGAGSGTFDETTDANEAIRDRGDTAYLTATAVTVSDKTGFSLSAAGVQAIWDALSSALTTVGSIGKRLVDDLTGDIYARLGAPAGASVSADVAAVKAVLPSALVSGRIDASVGAMAAGVLTATAIAADAITAAKVADGTIDAATFAAGAINAAAIAADAITDAKVAADVTIASVTGAVGSVTGAVGSVTGNVGGNVTGSVGSVATGGISAASFAAGAIDAAAIATDAIGSAELAASAITEIQSGLSTLDAAGVRSAVGLGSANLDTQLDALPTAAENRAEMDSNSTKLAHLDADVSSRLATSGYTAPLTAAGTRTAVGLASANLDTQIAAVQADTDDIQTRLPAALTGAGNLKADAQVVSDKTLYGLTAAYDAAKTAAQAGDAMTLTAAYNAAKTASQAGDAMALTSGERTSVGTAVWASATRTLTSFGTLVSDIWAAVADSAGVTTLLTRLTATRAGYLDNLSAGVPTPGAIADQVWEETLADHSGTAGSTAAGLNAAGAAGDPWATAVPGAYGAGTAGNILGTNLDAAVSSRTKPADTQAAVTLVATTTTLTNDPTGVTTLLSRLSALRAGYLDNLSAGAAALQSSLQGLVTTVGAAGAGLTATASAVWAVATRVLTAGTNIALAKGVGVTGFNDLDAAGVRSAVGLASANLDTKFVTIATLIGALNDLSSADVQTAVDTLLAAAITSDDMPAVGDRPSVYQAAYLGFQFFVERNVTGTTMTVSKADGSGALVTVTLDDAAAPTALTRAS